MYNQIEWTLYYSKNGDFQVPKEVDLFQVEQTKDNKENNTK